MTAEQLDEEMTKWKMKDEKVTTPHAISVSRTRSLQA
jgi:hypothetical protein